MPASVMERYAGHVGCLTPSELCRFIRLNPHIRRLRLIRMHSKNYIPKHQNRQQRQRPLINVASVNMLDILAQIVPLRMLCPSNAIEKGTTKTFANQHLLVEISQQLPLYYPRCLFIAVAKVSSNRVPM